MSQLPFALGEDRLRTLYLLPLAGNEHAVLELRADAARPLRWNGLPVDSLSVADYLAKPVVGPCYDAVFLVGVLGRPTHSASVGTAQQLIEIASGALRPGGMLVAHLDHGAAPKQIWHLLKRDRGLRGLHRLRGFETAARCTASVNASGFQDTECYYVEPHADDPAALISSHPKAAKTHFVRTIRRNRPLYSRSGYWTRALCVQVGLGGLLQPHLFLWARKRC